MQEDRMAITTLNMSMLKQAKNAVIGNPTAKRALAKDDAFIRMLVDCINEPAPYIQPSQGSKDDIRVEAAHVLASLAYGSSDALQSLLRANAHQAFLFAISNFQPSDFPTIKAAFARALRALVVAIAETVGPSQWGLQDQASELREEATIAFDYLFQLEALDVYLPLLVDPFSQTCNSIAQLLASALRSQSYRIAVSEWLPQIERHKEVKGKRGWEKPDTVNSPSRQGGWVARQLVALLQRKDTKLQEAVLSALASLAKDNPAVATKLAKAPPEQKPALSQVISMCKSRITDMQLAACLCATSIIRAGFPGHSLQSDPTSSMTVIHVINSLISSDSETPRTRTKACFILYQLACDDKDLCQLAYDRGSLEKLAALIKAITPSEASMDWDEDEPESISSLREAGLTAIAAIALFDNDIRCDVTDNLRLIPYIQISLAQRHVGVRYAACQCARALSRAVSVLRTNIVDTGLGLAVYQIFRKKDEDPRVTLAASAAICNLVNDFSPLRAVLLEQGVIERLVQLLSSREQGLMLNALWAFKNLLYKSTIELKRQVMQGIGWNELASLLLHEDLRLQEQAFHVVRHLADGDEGIEMVFQEVGSDVLLGSLSQALESENDDVLRQAVCVLGNLANSSPRQRDILAHPRILSSLRSCLVDAKVEVRRPAAACVLELVRANPRSHRELHEAGIDSTLRHMCDYGGGGILSLSPTTRYSMGLQMGMEDDREVKEKAREALHWFEHRTLHGGDIGL